MARIETDKKINPTQLGIELGRVPLKVGGGYVESGAVTEAELRAAVDAHVADDAYVDPQYVPPPDPDQELRDAIAGATTLDELKAALTGSGPAAIARVAARPAK